MSRSFRSGRWAWPAVAALGLSLAVLAPRVGTSATTPTSLWSDRPVAVTSAPGLAPNWVALVKMLKPAVVNISTKWTERGLPDLQVPPDAHDPFQQFFKQFFPNRPRTVRNLGSGFIINPTGYVVTNNHVIDEGTEIHLKLADGRELPATVVGRDPKTDLALLKVDGTDLPVIALGDSTTLAVGAPVMAIGNPFGFEETVTRTPSAAPSPSRRWDRGMGRAHGPWGTSSI
jgi:serine protease Do